MGEYLSTDISSPQVVAAGGLLTGGLTITSPAAGHFYMIAEQYTEGLVFIPGSRAYLHQAVAGGSFVSSTVNYSVWSPTVAGEEFSVPVELTLLNTDCYLFVFLKEIAAVVPAGSLVAGTTYKILSVGTTDFTLVGASSNTVGVVFVATGAGAGTGVACTTPDPDTDDTIDSVAVAIQSSAGLNVSELMNLMITMMIVVMMMKMMISSIQPRG